MKNFIRVMSLILALLLVMTAAFACGKKDDDEGKDPEATTTANDENSTEYANIAGEYLLDASDLGMPMKWFVKITPAGNFKISTTRDFSTLKGEGKVGNSGDTYMFVYSDNSAENPKTATFKIDGVNLVFSTSVPIGAASVSPNEEDKIYPTAKLITQEDILGVYMGEYEKVSPMAGTVLYSYELELGYGLEYSFSSSFEMMGKTYTIAEEGTFARDNETIKFTAKTRDGEAIESPAEVSGTIKDKTIKAAFILSAMASAPQEVEAKFAAFSAYADTYVGIANLSMGGMMTLQYAVAIDLDAFGNYKYAATGMDNTVSYSEEGTYTVADGKISLKSSAEGSTAVEAAFDGYVVSVSLPISSAVTTPVEMKLYSSAVSGEFMAETENNGKKYMAMVYLMGEDFMMAVGEKEAEDAAYYVKGKIEIQKAMTTNLVFKIDGVYSSGSFADADKITTNLPDVLTKNISAPISDSGINVELPFDLDDSALLGFQLEKAEAGSII